MEGFPRGSMNMKTAGPILKCFNGADVVQRVKTVQNSRNVQDLERLCRNFVG
jgi:hypothetical protein